MALQRRWLIRILFVVKNNSCPCLKIKRGQLFLLSTFVYCFAANKGECGKSLKAVDAAASMQAMLTITA